MAKPCALTVVGMLDDSRYHMAAAIAKNLAQQYSHVTADCRPMPEVEWTVFVKAKAKALAGRAYDHRTSPICYYNGVNYIGNEGDLVSWAQQAFRYDGKPNSMIYNGKAKVAWSEYLAKSKHDIVYMEFSQGDTKLGQVVFELYKSVCPKTCENFRALCTGEKGTSSSGTKLSYKGTMLHRVKKGAFIQGGDISGETGAGGESIYGPVFGDETFSVKHDSPGILAMASSGRHTNNSQFYVTLLPMPWLDTKSVAFGRVLKGLRVLQVASSTAHRNQRPEEPIVCTACGMYSDFRKAKRAGN